MRQNRRDTSEHFLGQLASLEVGNVDRSDKFDDHALNQGQNLRQDLLVVDVILESEDGLDEGMDQLEALLGSLSLHHWCNLLLDFGQLINTFELKALDDFRENFVSFLLRCFVVDEDLHAPHQCNVVLFF